MLDNSKANQQSESDESTSSDEDENAQVRKPKAKKTQKHLYSPVLRVKRVEALIPRVSREIKVGDELVGYRLIFRSIDDDEDQMPSSAAAEDDEEGYTDVYHAMPWGEKLSKLRGSDASANCSVSELTTTLLQYPLSDYCNEDEDTQSTYQIQFFFVSKPQLSGAALPPSELDPKVNLSCRAVAVDSMTDPRLPNKTSLKVWQAHQLSLLLGITPHFCTIKMYLKWSHRTSCSMSCSSLFIHDLCQVQIGLGEHHQESATLMPTTVLVKPPNRVEHVPVDAASEEVKSDTCVFMPAAGVLIGYQTPDNR